MMGGFELLSGLQVPGELASQLAGSLVVQVMAGTALIIGVGSPGVAWAVKIARSIRLNGSGRQGNGTATVAQLATLSAELRALDRTVERNYDDLCDRISEGNERTDRALADRDKVLENVWTVINGLRDRVPPLPGKGVA